jgi:alpha-tubulin suppressor-like RCC1 family protein
MPNFSGVWNLKEQIQAVAAGTWTGLPAFELYSWGSNGNGTLGDGTTISKSSPVQVGFTTNWLYVSTGGDVGTTVATKSDGTLWSWGGNSSGELGQGDVINRSSPTQVGALTDWDQISMGFASVAAVKSNGTLWTWGSNGSSGTLGDGQRLINRSSPAQVGALTNWLIASVGSLHCAAVKTDGTLWTWGANSFGQLGTTNVISRSSPVQVGALTNWYRASAGGSHTVATQTGGTAWAWGQNNEGQLGQSNVLRRSSPVQIGALTDWAQIAGGVEHTGAVKTGGTLWMWGRNNEGQLGNASVDSASSPIQIGALTTWSVAAPGRSSISAALKTDGTLWTWGSGDNGALGSNTASIPRSSPVQVGALTGWYELSCGNNAMAAIYQGVTN